MEYQVEDVVLYIIKKMGEVQGMKKLMKLVFLTQYESKWRLGRVIVKYTYGGHPAARAEFYIWSFGPMSNEVYDAVEGLEERGLVEIRFGEYTEIVAKGGRGVSLPPPVAARLDEVVEKYGRRRGWELERIVNEMLGLDIEEKKLEYLGLPVDKYLELEGVRLEKKELAHGRYKAEPQPPSG